MDELIKKIKAISERLELLLQALRLDEKKKKRDALKHLMVAPDFWSDRRTAESVSQEASELDDIVTFWSSIEQRLADLRTIAYADQLATDVSLLDELEKELQTVTDEIDQREMSAWLNGPYDRSPAIVTIYSGAGGVDAQDWAEMLERMYLRFADRQGFSARVLQRTIGQEAGIKNVTIRFAGSNAYGYLRMESGVHRLVRISPFDADQSRHTSFAMVEVLPELERPATIEVPKEDVRVDVFRASGHGGQSVNTTDSAVRLTHLPTGIVTTCQNERSQLQNKEQAWRMLLGKLERYYQAQREEERQLLRGEFTEAAWGNQIRSYVLHPYKMVKDHRTKFEVHEPDDILEGNIMPFIEAALRMELSK